jgi:hypothetical protein
LKLKLVLLWQNLKLKLVFKPPSARRVTASLLIAETLSA